MRTTGRTVIKRMMRKIVLNSNIGKGTFYYRIKFTFNQKKILKNLLI